MKRHAEVGLRPVLAPGARLRFDRHSGQYVLLSAERGLLLNESAAEIVRRCDGVASIEQIAAQIAPPDSSEKIVTEDVLELLRELQRRRLLSLCGAAP